MTEPAVSPQRHATQSSATHAGGAAHTPHTHTFSAHVSLSVVSLFPQESLAIGLSLTPHNARVWLVEQEESTASKVEETD